MTLFSSTGSQLFLQSVNEQRHKGGLFAVSAEYIRPSGSSELPGTIPTSEGDVTVYPEPTITKGTDGFERVNATGYAIWTTQTSLVKQLAIGLLNVTVVGWKLAEDQPEPPAPPLYEQHFTKFVVRVLFESSHQKKMRAVGTITIPSTPELKVLNNAGVEITQYSDAQDTSAVGKVVALTNIQVTNFGTVEQVEVMHSILDASVELTHPYPSV
jgi:hypothetical protein